VIAEPERLRRLPKAEVHVHLEGCFEVEHLESLAREAGQQLPRPPEALFDFDDLPSFLSFLDWACSLVRTPEQAARAAYRFSAREKEAGAWYADVIVNPTHWPAWHGRLSEFIDALDAGFSEAEQDGLPAVGLCVSLLRQQSALEAAELVDLLIERRHPRVVALSVDGNEASAGRTGPRFAGAFAKAGASGLHRTVHAGESSGPEGVRDAIDLLGAERIDHGVRASEDPALMRELADRRTPLGVCPNSNVVLGLYPDRAAHPVEKLRTSGVRVSLNTDDPALLDCDLSGEYAASANAYGWSEDVLRAVARTSIEAAFCDEDRRRDMRVALAAWSG
jgi:adenosine deaminase